VTHDAVAQALARSDVFRGLAADQLDRLARECLVALAKEGAIDRVGSRIGSVRPDRLGSTP
jgi:hypothetical protein